jgi:uncharacterized protein
MQKYIILFILIVSLPIYSASFDCNKASSLSEMMICNDPELSRLDDELSDIYKQAKKAAANEKQFKQQTQASWTWREKNCQDKECLINWYSNRKITLQKIIDDNKGASLQTYNYEPSIFTFQGKLISAPGETPDGEKITYPALQLIKPITVQGDKDTPTEKGVILMQMVLDQKMMDTFKSLKNESASVTGTMFHSDNGNHQTNVLITVSSISQE